MPSKRGKTRPVDAITKIGPPPSADLIPELVAAVKKIAYGKQMFSLDDVKKQLPAYGIKLNLEIPMAVENVRRALESAERIKHTGLCDGQEMYRWEDKPLAGGEDAQGYSGAVAEAGAVGADPQVVDPGQSQTGPSQDGQAAKRKRGLQESANQENGRNGSGYAKRRASIKASEKLTQLSQDMRTSNADYLGERNAKVASGKLSPGRRTSRAAASLGTNGMRENARCERKSGGGRRCMEACDEGSNFCAKHMTSEQASQIHAEQTTNLSALKS